MTSTTRPYPWFAVGAAGLALLLFLVASGAVCWSTLNQVPSYVPLRVVLPVPNAYDDYVAAAAMCRLPAGEGSNWWWQKFTPEDGMPLEPMRAAVERNRAALPRLRQGFGKQYCAPPVTSLDQAIPELALYQRLARVLVAQGKLAEREGRMAEAARSYRDCLRFGVDVPRGGGLIHGLVGHRIQGLGLRALEQSIDRLDGPTAAAVARAMIALDQRAISFADSLAGDKEAITVGILDLFRHRTVWELFLADGHPIAQAYFWMESGFPSKRTVLANYRRYMDAGIADAGKPYYAEAAPPFPRDRYDRIFAPDFSVLKVKWAARHAHWRIIELRLAARGYQCRHGRPPASAQRLVPAYLPAVPRDPYADRPLVYRMTGNRGIVYSRGPDGKDDGGKDLGASVYPDLVGDIVTLKKLRRR